MYAQVNMQYILNTEYVTYLKNLKDIYKHR